MPLRFRPAVLLAAILLGPAAGCSSTGTPASGGTRPAPDLGPVVPPVWTSLIGDYGLGSDTLSLLEDADRLRLKDWRGTTRTLRSTTDSTLVADDGTTVRVRRTPGGQAYQLAIGERTFARFAWGPAEGNVFRITPRRDVETLRRESLAATPPVEAGDFRPSDLVELAPLDPTIKLDVRYAGTDNFMGVPLYSSARAFLQRPAAEGLARAHRKLRAKGFGLLIHDGYRPWYVTRMFWEATPDSLRVFVADPSRGSRHNRGCAVDLTLYELATGQPVEMPGVYDEMSPRSYPTYPGGTTRQRALRETLREAMEAEGFAVYEAEWWHFDYKDWRSYRIGNQRFEELARE
ncbi:MAG TPA: M15 family metallopeptidase [Gemmatimonadales bacterium]